VRAHAAPPFFSGRGVVGLCCLACWRAPGARCARGTLPARRAGTPRASTACHCVPHESHPVPCRHRCVVVRGWCCEATCTLAASVLHLT
jgi:hypothetical protein